MENVLEIKNRIHKFVESADERILRVINAIVVSEEKDFDGLSDEHKSILDERLREHKSDPNSGEPWEEVRAELKKDYGL